eukprot:scaffold77762_cov49-Attheya_sp.AAC.2
MPIRVNVILKRSSPPVQEGNIKAKKQRTVLPNRIVKREHSHTVIKNEGSVAGESNFGIEQPTPYY